MMLLIFIALLVAVGLAWIGYRQWAIFCFAITLLFATVYFYQDMTLALNLQL